jgi:hypothetical protein
MALVYLKTISVYCIINNPLTLHPLHPNSKSKRITKTLEVYNKSKEISLNLNTTGAPSKAVGIIVVFRLVLD